MSPEEALKRKAREIATEAQRRVSYLEQEALELKERLAQKEAESEAEAGITYRCGKGSTFFLFPTQHAGTGQHTLGGWLVDDIEKAVAVLRDRGVAFEEYDFPGLGPGDRWCVVAMRWLQSHRAGVAAPVVLAATNELALEIIGALPKGHAELADQLLRAAQSQPRNIAEGAGRRTSTAPCTSRRRRRSAGSRRVPRSPGSRPATRRARRRRPTWRCARRSPSYTDPRKAPRRLRT